MHCIYDNDFEVNKKLLKILNLFDNRKILVVNGFIKKGLQVLEGENFDGFSLEEEGIKKTNQFYFERLLEKFNLFADQVIYFDHNEDNVKSAQSLGILSIQYDGSNEKIRNFIEENIEY